MRTYNSRMFTKETWPRLKAFAQTAAQKVGATGWSACLEESLAARACPEQTPLVHVPEIKVYHGHIYLLWLTGDTLEFQNTDGFVFEGVRPRVDVCTVRNPKGFRASAFHGLWYVHVMKRGTIDAASNMAPWEHYKPKTSWVVGLWESHKLEHEQYEDLSALFRSGHADRMKDLDRVRRSEQAAAVRDHVQQVAKALEIISPLGSFRCFPEIEQFVASFRACSLHRRPILALIGGTNLGKSLLAANALSRVGDVLGIHGFVEITVEDDKHLDFSRFDVSKHAGVLLDGIGDAQVLIDNRESLQGRAKVSFGGRSATMIYAYPYTLCQRAVVATFDLGAKGLDMFTSHHWLSNPDNVLVLRLESSARASS